MRAFVATAAIAALAIGPCDGDQPFRGHSNQEVVSYVETRTGQRLVEVHDSPGADPDYAPTYFAQAGTLSDSGAIRALRSGRFGLYSIVVVHDERGFDFELNPGGAESHRDPDGTYWYRAPEGHPRGGPGWSASRVYGNVILTWEAGRKRRFDRRFFRLDRILRSLPPPS